MALTLIVLIPVQSVLIRLPWRLNQRLPMVVHRSLTAAVGVRTTVIGEQSHERPTFFACNHVSYVDIPVIGGIVRGSFVAKSEIAGWPVIGSLSRLQRTIFVQRRARYAAGQRDELSDRMQAGDGIILFPEGTSGDGNGVLPFKSALFAAAELEVDGRPVLVQPVSISYPKLDGIPLGRAFRHLICWVGDEDLAPHAWRLMGLGRIEAVVQFHDPVRLTDFDSRKELAEHCYQAVSTGVAASNSGRLSEGRSIPLPGNRDRAEAGAGAAGDVNFAA